MTAQTPPRLADWILSRVLPLGKRGESILGDLHEEFRLAPSRGWYWKQTLVLTLRYLTHSSQPSLSYPRNAPMWFDIRGDLRTALRMVQLNPGTSSLIVVTLALAIGAATVGLAFADLALFRGLPVDDLNRVVSVFASDTHGSNPRARVSGPDLLDYRARTTTLVELSGMREGRAPLITNGQSQTLTVGYATANVFTAMGQHAIAGREFRSGDDAPGAPLVAVLSSHYWRDAMQSRPDAIGRTLQIGRDLVTVVGVLSPDIEFGNLAEVDLWLPLTLRADDPRDARSLRFIARLKDGVTFEAAAAEMAAIGSALASEYPLTNGGWSLRLVPIRNLTGGQGFWVVVVLFLLSVVLLIAIATANVSNLIMVRAAARARELAVRAALGAKGGRLLRQFFVEGLVLSVAGAALSVLVAQLGLHAIAAFSPEPIFQQLQIDLHELSFVALLTLVCPVVFCAASMRLIARPDLRELLATQGGRGSTAIGRGRSVLVVAQIALAVVLLTASTLAMQSIRNAFSQPLGMKIDRLATFAMDFNDAMYPDVAAARAAAQEIRTSVAKVSGVTRVSAVSNLPVLGDVGPVALTIGGRTAMPGDAMPTIVVTGADADAGSTLGVPLLAGNWWTEGARDGAVITKAAAMQYFGGIDTAIGRPVSFQVGQSRVAFRVTGVSADVANTDRMASAPPRIWIPMLPLTRRITFIVEGRDITEMATGIRSVAARVAPAVPIEGLEAFSESMRRAEASDYVIFGTLGGFSLVALALATTGLFGVISFTVSQRTAEFGTRLALGASVGAVIAIVTRQSLRLLIAGLSVGLLGGVLVGFGMRSMLFGTSPADPATLAGIAVSLLIVTMAATALPAWRASRIDPVIALRAE